MNMITPEEIFKRAIYGTKHRTTYKLGFGGMNPNNDVPSQSGKCDCSGFAAWCLGIPRYQPDSIGWVETSRIVNDALGAHKLFRRVTEPKVGDLIVYGDRDGHEGHVGVVTAMNDSQPFTVAHCNARTSDAIVNEEFAKWWKQAIRRYGAIYARYNGIVEEDEEMDRITVRVGATRFVGYRDGETNFIPLASVKPFLEKHGAQFGWDPKAAEVKIDLPKGGG